MITVGVVLGAEPDDIGEWLADGAAFEAAGAGALWVDPGADGTLDPLILAAALAAVTVRSLVVTTLSERPSPSLVRTLVTVGRLSRGRLRVLADEAFPDVAGADVAGEDIAAGGGFGVFRRVAGDADVFEDTYDPAERPRWLAVASPDSRSAWRATMLDATERGYSRLMVPANPRLLDILRNSDEPDDRRDLQLAMG